MSKHSPKFNLNRVAERAGIKPSPSERHWSSFERVKINAVRLGLVALMGITAGMTYLGIKDSSNPRPDRTEQESPNRSTRPDANPNANAGENSPPPTVPPPESDLPNIPTVEHNPTYPTAPPVNENPSLKR